MALSMDEQRALAEIERRLAADDPGLATCMTAFRRPGPARVLRSPRARIVGSLFTVLLVAMVSLMVYAMIPFRAHSARVTPTSGPATTALSPAGSVPSRSQSPASPSASTATSTKVTATATAPSAVATASPPKDQAVGQVSSSAAGP
jgi:hypothetical protein